MMPNDTKRWRLTARIAETEQNELPATLPEDSALYKVTQEKRKRLDQLIDKFEEMMKEKNAKDAEDLVEERELQEIKSLEATEQKQLDKLKSEIETAERELGSAKRELKRRKEESSRYRQNDHKMQTKAMEMERLQDRKARLDEQAKKKTVEEEERHKRMELNEAAVVQVEDRIQRNGLTEKELSQQLEKLTLNLARLQTSQQQRKQRGRSEGRSTNSTQSGKDRDKEGNGRRAGKRVARSSERVTQQGSSLSNDTFHKEEKKSDWMETRMGYTDIARYATGAHLISFMQISRPKINITEPSEQDRHSTKKNELSESELKATKSALEGKIEEKRNEEKQRRIERFEQIKEGLEMKRKNEQGTVAGQGLGVGVRAERKGANRAQSTQSTQQQAALLEQQIRETRKELQEEEKNRDKWRNKFIALEAIKKQFKTTNMQKLEEEIRSSRNKLRELEADEQRLQALLEEAKANNRTVKRALDVLKPYDSEEALFEKLVEEEKQLDRRIERAEAEYRTKEAGKI
ncbi:hypothetical protein WR25_24795 [Diploscapter pachys]|uniref:Uncharacterized protein n=1 Tax=Diploscapter pachys TaxID=2018661 RepID=A0A2A2KRQ9_9BILA|nr:hypothetical protein WR25_24795 [Diploscapter pachys]